MTTTIPGYKSATLIRVAPNDREKKLLSLNGLPGYLFKSEFYILENFCRKYTSTSSKLKPISISKEDTINHYGKLSRNIEYAEHISCISSEPNDLRAKIMAGSLMLDAQRRGLRCKWHTIIGGYKDEVIDKPHLLSDIDVLFLSNVPYISTPQKKEKLRDILEMNHKIPRVVVTTGCDPIKLFNEIGLYLNHPIWVKASRYRRSI